MPEHETLTHEQTIDGGAQHADLKQRRGLSLSSWGAGAWLCLAIALYFIASAAFAIVNFERYGAAPPQFLRYIVAPAVLAVGFLAVPFRLGRDKTLLVGIYATSILAALFLAEAVLTIRMLPTLSGSLGRLDQEQRRAVEDDQALIRGFTLRRLNKLAEVDSLAEAKLSGFAGARTILCSPPGGLRIYTADRYGFNNPDQVYDGAIDIALVGDSFIEGLCLPADKDLTAVLRAQSDDNVVNLGIRGNGPLIELATLGRFGPTLRPRQVIMAFFEGNDWKNFGFELTEPWLRTALDADADFGNALPAAPATERRSWDLVQTLTEQPVTMVELMRRTSLLRNFFALHRVGLTLGIVYPKVPPERAHYQTVLARARSIVEAWGGTLSLLYIPQVGRFGGLLPTGFVFDQLRWQVLDAAAAADVDVIDLTPMFAADADPRRFYAADAHFSEAGAAFVADLLSKDSQGQVGQAEAGDREP